MNTKLPCIDCLCLAICKFSQKSIKSNDNIGPILTSLGEKCSSFLEYLTLKDLGLDARDIDDSLPMSKRKHIIVPLAQRIVETVEYMGWDYDLTRDRMIADGLIPDGEDWD